jgi:SAM-dependent methyltransferase
VRVASAAVEKGNPLIGFLKRLLGSAPDAAPVKFENSSQYWEDRYRAGGNSGVGSYGQFATFKADFLNKFVADHAVQSVIEFGCGDGNQLNLFRFPSYTGVDVSKTVVERMRERHAADSSKKFLATDAPSFGVHDLSLSLDVIYHLVEDPIFDAYMRSLFGAAGRFVIVYASNGLPPGGYEWGPHVRHRKFTDWVAQNTPQWKLAEHVANPYPYKRVGTEESGSFADFFVFEKTSA